MVTVNSTVTGMSGRRYRLEKEIGSGGEGSVFTVQGCRLVAKIYKKVVAAQEQKLLHMVYHHMPNLYDQAGKRILTLAWPSDVLYDSSGSFIGYIMPLIDGGVEIFEICRGCTGPKAKRLFPNYSWKLNVEVAKNLATAVDYLHSQNCVIGDMNCKNILVNADGSVSILDADSFDLTDPQTGTHYKCGAGTEDYLAPELQGRNLRQESARFTPYSDTFALAIHIFQLLMDNYHPFNCRQLNKVKNSSNANPRLEQICQGKSPYIKKYPDVDIPLGAPAMAEVLPPSIRQNFMRTFDYTGENVHLRMTSRTPAKKWAQDLDALLQECNAPGGLIRCEDHEYLASMHSCGRCKARRRYEAFHKAKVAASPVTPKEVPRSHVSSGAAAGQAAAPTVAQHQNKTAPVAAAPGGKSPKLSLFSTLLRIYNVLFVVAILCSGFFAGEDSYYMLLIGAIPVIAIAKMESFRRNGILHSWAPNTQPWALFYALWMLMEHLVFLTLTLMPPVLVISMVIDQTWDADMFLTALVLLPVAVNRIFFQLGIGED